MSQGNVGFELQDGYPLPEPSTTPVKVLNVKNATHGKVCVFGYVNGDPATYAKASDGYTSDFAKGCVLVDTSNGKIKTNDGAITAPTWQALT